MVNDVTFEDEDYRPIMWTVNGGEYYYPSCSDQSSLEIVLALLSENLTFAKSPNQSLEKSATLSWIWPFDDNTSPFAGNISVSPVTERSKKDTILGDLIALGNNPALADGSYVVVGDGTGYIALKLGAETMHASTDDSIPAQVITYAYKATEEDPEDWTDSDNVAILTESFGTSLTVTQVD